MKKLFPSSKTITHFFIIFPLLIIAVSIAYYLIIFLPEKEKFRQEIEKEKVSIERESQNKNDEQFQTCISDAKTEFKRLLELNSKPDPQPDYPDARLWKDDEAKNYVLDRYQTAEELCVKKYK